MNLTTLMVCKGLISKENHFSLVAFLPEKDQAILRELPPVTTLTPEHLKWDLLDHIHFTWIAPFLRTLSTKEIANFLSILTPNQKQGLHSLLGYENHPPELPEISRYGLKHILLKQLKQNQDLVPFAFLPKHPLNALLKLSSNRLCTLIRYLGLHDLSYEMRQIISTKELKKIFANLTEKEGEYINSLLLHREPLVFKRLFLEKWKGTKEELHKLLEERGANRIAHLLYDGSKSLIWYFIHALPMHIGTMTLKYIEKPTHARAQELLLNQVEKILHFLPSEDLAV